MLHSCRVTHKHLLDIPTSEQRPQTDFSDSSTQWRDQNNGQEIRLQDSNSSASLLSSWMWQPTEKYVVKKLDSMDVRMTASSNQALPRPPQGAERRFAQKKPLTYSSGMRGMAGPRYEVPEAPAHDFFALSSILRRSQVRGHFQDVDVTPWLLLCEQ